MRVQSASRAALSLLSLALSCATVAGGEGGDVALPNAGAGPFRPIVREELGNLRSAPNAIDDSTIFVRDPAIVDRDGDPSTFEVWGFFSATFLLTETSDPDPLAPPNAIVRYGALDGRSFDRDRVVVLSPMLAWEGATVGSPAALFQGEELFLYYAAAGGIGLARSDDGESFTRENEPVLAPDPNSWEGGAPPRSPAVVRLWDGSLRMFYEVADGLGSARIGEARSDDGVTWTRINGAAVLEPSSAGSGDDEPYDDASVGAPFATIATSADGRDLLRLYYAARDQSGHETIGLAARFGPDGPFVRAVSPVFGTGSSLAPREPCVLDYGDFALLFATQLAGRTSGKAYPAVAVGVAPADASLPPANPK